MKLFVEIKDSNLSPILIRLRFIFAWEADELLKFERLVPLLIISNNVSKIASSNILYFRIRFLSNQYVNRLHMILVPVQLYSKNASFDIFILIFAI